MLRGIAVALVIVQHAVPHQSDKIGLGISSGIVGVVIFFALSGYLITGLLLSDARRYGRLRYRRFYTHRLLRLYPPLLVMLLAYVIFQHFARNDAGSVTAAVVGALYLGDLPHFATLTHSIGHLWSLAVEEQFYIVWPAIVLFAVRRGRLKAMVITALVIAELATFAGPAAHQTAFALYNYPTSWAIALVIGSAARVFEAELDRVLSRNRAHLTASAVAALVLCAISGVGGLNATFVTYCLLGPVIAASSVVIIFWLKSWQSLPVGWLRPLLGLGVVSYAAYLWNLPIADALFDTNMAGSIAGLLSAVLTVLAAVLSWFLIEEPVRRYRSRLDRKASITAVPASKAG